jgi:hypothetical protein
VTTGFRTHGVKRKMAKNIHARQIGRKTNVEGTKWSSLDANELKADVRDGLVSMTIADREQFISTLEAEMRRAGLNMRSYLVPLGIPGRSPEDLTPTEVAHLIRFLKLNVPQAMRAVDRALSQYRAFSDKHEAHRIAA